MDRVLSEFRSRFLGKVSPVHLFWGGLDLAVTRFSGRTAPPHPGGAPNCGPHVMLEAYSHEVSSAGYWPGPDGEGVFYSYAYPEPAGFRVTELGIADARYDEQLGEFVLPYATVRTDDDPDAVLLQFLQASYEAAADHAAWDRTGARTLTDAARISGRDPSLGADRLGIRNRSRTDHWLGRIAPRTGAASCTVLRHHEGGDHAEHALGRLDVVERCRDPTDRRRRRVELASGVHRRGHRRTGTRRRAGSCRRRPDP